MLSQLYIKNVAVISEAAIDFADGLNIFTGETGAGKSILINAINAVLGERASKDLIRTGEQQAVISALFSGISKEACQLFSEAGYSLEEDAVLIHREISMDGKSSCKIDGRPATVSILKTVAAALINIHGQHDNQQLLSAQKHLGFIDAFAQNGELRARYQAAYHAWTDSKRELLEIDTDEAQKQRRMELLRYQVEEIDAAALVPTEEEELKSRRNLIKNALRVTQALGSSAVLLDGDDEMQGLSTLFGQLLENMGAAAQYMEEAQPISERLTDLFYELEGFSADIHRLLEDFDCDPHEIDAIEARLDCIYSLKSKYGANIEAVLAYRDRAAAELLQIETSDERAEKLRKQIAKQEKEAYALAGTLSKSRKKAAVGFTEAVQTELCFLDMPGVTLSVRQEEKALCADGGDAIELLISTNAGETAKSLAKIASGGELARIMLSIKNVMAGHDAVQTLIFDEVDTGVSGRAAQKIGQKLAQVAKDRQVIVVTHLAQVASYANHHLLIAKTARNGRTFTEITPLSRTERIRELARISGGENITDLALRHAEEMLKAAGK